MLTSSVAGDMVNVQDVGRAQFHADGANKAIRASAIGAEWQCMSQAPCATAALPITGRTT